MPVTPLHFGPAGVLSFAFKKYLDLPVFVLANVVVDLEVLAVMFFLPNGTVHGIMHTFFVGGIIGAVFGGIGYRLRRPTGVAMKLIKLPYQTSLKIAVWSGVLGVWFHVLIDSFIYRDIKPFGPLSFNPFFGLITKSSIYLICLALCLLALGWYIWKAAHYRSNKDY